MGTSRKMCQAAAPSRSHSWKMSLKLCRLLRVTVVLIMEGHPGLLEEADAPQGGVECAGHAAEVVMAGGIGPVDGDGHPSTPASRIFSASSGVMSVPLGEKAQGRPLAWA